MSLCAARELLSQSCCIGLLLLALLLDDFKVLVEGRVEGLQTCQLPVALCHLAIMRLCGLQCTMQKMEQNKINSSWLSLGARQDPTASGP